MVPDARDVPTIDTAFTLVGHDTTGLHLLSATRNWRHDEALLAFGRLRRVVAPVPSVRFDATAAKTMCERLLRSAE
jgi:hypothetical protein